jgi:N-glycosylase/DNA lyase
MDNLVCALEEAAKGGSLKKVIDARMAEFSELGKKDEKELFKEMCFCLLTANYSAEGGIRMQREVGNGFLTLPEETLAGKLRELGYRFPNVRAHYIAQARRHMDFLPRIMKMPAAEARAWLVSNVKGLGMKEASHFLRNVGFTDLAIIDFHIVDILGKHGLIEKPKTKALTPKKYAEVEAVLRRLSGKMRMNLGELDLYLWYCETGKVLK